MNKDNINQDDNSNEDIFLSFIDEERNKDTEIRFSIYIKKYFSFEENEYYENGEKENDDDFNEHQPQTINIINIIKRILLIILLLFKIKIYCYYFKLFE